MASTAVRVIQKRYSWAWWNESAHKEACWQPQAILDRNIFLALKGSLVYHDHKYYPSRWDAELALQNALTKLRNLLAV